MGVFGPWLPWLFGSGAVLLAGGLLVGRSVPDPTAAKLGRAAASAGWRMMLLAATMYLMILALAAVFENVLSNLPGA